MVAGKLNSNNDIGPLAARILQWQGGAALAAAAVSGLGWGWHAGLSALAGGAIGVIAIVMTGLGFAFAEGGSAMRKGIGIVFGLAIAFTATTFVSSFFNLTAGAAF